MATALSISLLPKTLPSPSLPPLKPSLPPLKPSLSHNPTTSLRPTTSLTHHPWTTLHCTTPARKLTAMAAVDGDYTARRSSISSSNNGEQRESIMLPGCDYKHWLIVMEFPKDPAPTREQMIDTYLDTLASVLGSMEEAKKNMYAFSTTTYTGFQCTVDEETSEKFKGLPGVLWVLPDSYIDVKNKDYGGDKYINGEIIPCKYPTYQPKQRNAPKYESRRYERRRDGPPRTPTKSRQGTTPSDSPSS